MLTKDEFESNILQIAKEKKLDELKPKIHLLQTDLIGFYGSQTIDINCKPTKDEDIKNLYQEDVSKLTYQFIYTLKTHTFDYQHGLTYKSLKYKHFKIKEENWGNLYKSCLDLNDFDWIMNHEHAKHVLDIAPTDFYEMEYFLRVCLDYLNKKRIKYQC